MSVESGLVVDGHFRPIALEEDVPDDREDEGLHLPGLVLHLLEARIAAGGAQGSLGIQHAVRGPELRSRGTRVALEPQLILMHVAQESARKTGTKVPATAASRRRRRRGECA